MKAAMSNSCVIIASIGLAVTGIATLAKGSTFVKFDCLKNMRLCLCATDDNIAP